MSDASLAALVAARAPILADGAIETRIMFETELVLDEHLQVAVLPAAVVGRAALRDIYAGYVAVAREHGLPAILGTPTFRASARYVERAGRGSGTTGEAEVRGLNAAATELLQEVRTAAGAGPPIFIAGVIGPYGDAYTPADCLPRAAAAAYHRTQAQALAEAGVDLLFAPTYPSVAEATGAADAMAATGLPYAPSFVLDAEGRVLDGLSLAEAIARIDAAVDPAPAWYGISCVHASVAARALVALAATPFADRLRELKPNGSPLSPAELVALDHVEADDPERFGAAMAALRDAFGLPILGGCCGTDA
ncbi:MAG: homocysteine S-methyltransferase, partial [Conexibacter sp.]|nr:homocysteine S-methyltransferase [Conexibacter sp.]